MENDLEKMNKTMPYTIPEGFFEEMEERLMREVEPKQKSQKLRNFALWTGFAVAAGASSAAGAAFICRTAEPGQPCGLASAALFAAATAAAS